MPEINWYPGHMAKTRRILVDQVRSVDAVIELCDARAPQATRNPDLIDIARGKNHFLVMNKCDLANEAATRAWTEYFKSRGIESVKFQSTNGKAKDMFRLIETAAKPAVDRMKARGANKTVRVMVVGIPNVGKSTFINKLRGQAIAKASDRPGVTRSNQWVKVGPYLELLDTPGMLWPKLENQKSAKLLAYLGSIRDQIMDGEELAGELLKLLLSIAKNDTLARYKLPENADALLPEQVLECACKGRGWLLSGGRFDTERAAGVILDEFRGGKIGKITLEWPEGK
ncbi:MAG: ribosome biogenesis GTPase YlqF [Clostridia bacterium]|nr:ribosome biogenesis GTPase YlqF [Clostridia bacterium]